MLDSVRSRQVSAIPDKGGFKAHVYILIYTSSRYCPRISPSPLLAVEVGNSTRVSKDELPINRSAFRPHRISISGSTASARPAMDDARPFRRNYKACDNCRIKKKRCELGGDQQGVYGFTGPPCAQCRRERRQCVFREARDTKKRHYSDRSRPVTRASGRRGRSERLQLSSQTASSPSLLFDASLNLAATAPSPVFQVHRKKKQGIADKRDAAVEVSLSGSRNGLHGDAQILSDRSSKLVTDTTILKGNNAIDILLEAAAGQGSSSPASLVSSQPPSPRGGNPLTHSNFHQERLSPEGDTMSLSPKRSYLKLIKQSSIGVNVLSAWKSSGFVRMGLLSAEHAITLVDAYEPTILS